MGREVRDLDERDEKGALDAIDCALSVLVLDDSPEVY